MSSTALGRVLVVDDEFQLMDAIVESLTFQGYEAQGFSSGLQAIEALQKQEFDVLLTDLMMPAIDGITLLKGCLAIDPHLVGILMTGQGTVQTAVEAMKTGAFDYVLKPFRMEALLPVLTRAREVQRLRLENIQLRESLVIYNLSQTIAFSLDANLVLEKTLDAALQQMDAQEASIMLLTPEGDELQIAAIRGTGREELLGQRTPLTAGIAGWVAQQSEPLILNGEVTDGRFAPLWPRPEIRSAISMPMMTAGRLIGILNVDSLQARHPFTAGQVKALSILTSTAAAALDNEALYRALEKSEKRFRALIENAPDGITVVDARGIVIYASPSVERILGYSQAETLGRAAIDYVHPSDQSHFMRKLAQRIKKSSEALIEYRFKHKDGSWRWLESTVSNLITETSIKGIVFNYRDISEHKLAEEKLLLSDQILQRVNALVLVANSEGGIDYVSPVVKTILSYEPEELLGDGWWKVSRSDPVKAQREKEYVGKAARGEIPIATDPYERAIQDRHGNTHWILWVDALGPGNLLIGVGHDITERKRAEEQLSYQAYLLSNVNDAIMATDQNDQITYWNHAAETLYGWSEEEVLGQYGAEITKTEYPAIDADEMLQHIRAVGVWRGEVTHIKKDGTRFPCEISSLLLRAESGDVTGYVSINRDITERKQAEEAVRASEEQYRGLFEDSPISLWVEDFSEVKLRLDQLKKDGIEDVPGYLHEHPEFVRECANQVKVVDVNSASIRLYRASNKTELLGSLMDILPTIPMEQFQRELILLTDNQLNFEWEGVDETLTGEKIHVNLRWTVAPGYEDSLARVIVSTIDITNRKRAEEQAQLQIQRLRALRSIDLAISSSYNLDLTLDIFLNQVLTQLNVDAASVLLFQPFTRTLKYEAGRGFHSSAIRGASVRLGDGYAGMAVLERRMIHSSNLTAINRDLPPVFLLMLKEEGFVDYYCVPLIVKGEVKGVLEIYHRSILAGYTEWSEFLDTLAGQAAIAIEDATLFENLQRSNQELFQAYDATIEGWSHVLDLRDKETEGHTQRVTELSVELARRFGFAPEQLIHIRWGALLHDIGKMGVADNILLKPDKLTDEEWEIMRRHPTIAFEMLSPIAYLKSSLDIPYCHHEKWDGTGYPRGLKGELIPLAARLFAVIDVWDALRSDRPYRKAWSIEQTREHIRSLSGTHFDPNAVQYFLEMMEGSMD